jgi:phosphatidylglycerol---prolipoprotein diacylglyceryl transferase
VITPLSAMHAIPEWAASAMWTMALLSAITYNLRSAKVLGVDSREVYWASVIGLILGVWGGHVMGIFYYGSDGRPYAWLRFWSGGEAQYGGLIAGALAVVAYLRIRRLVILRYADAMVPAVALGVTIGRIGCFLNGDDFGTRATLPWAVTFPPGTEAYADHFNRGWIASSDPLSLSVHPVQLYASLFALALFVFFARWRPSQDGRRFAFFLILYGAGRFIDQYFRGDFQRVLGPLSLTQLISLLLMAVGMSLTMYLRTALHAHETALNPSSQKRLYLCQDP